MREKQRFPRKKSAARGEISVGVGVLILSLSLNLCGTVSESRSLSAKSMFTNKASVAQLAVLIFHVHRGKQWGGRKDGMDMRTKLVSDLIWLSCSSFHLFLCSTSPPSPPHCFPPPPLLLHIDGHLAQKVQILYWGEIKYLIMPGEEERDVISSECSSGCQSGWTAYLDLSSCDSSLPLEHKKSDSEEEEEEEEDLSMVSDASSGPPHFPEQDKLSLHCINSSTCFEGNDLVKCGNVKKRKVEPEQQYQEHCSSLLDDTASSPLVSQPKASFISEDISSYMKTPMEGDLEFSCGYSATHFEKKQMGFLQSTSLGKPRPTRPVKRFR